MSQKSMAPFVDNRSDEERKAYAKEQAVNRARNADLREWKKLKAALPESAPSTFAGFRSMKRANSQRYQNLKADYRETLDKSRQNGIILTGRDGMELTIDTLTPCLVDADTGKIVETSYYKVDKKELHGLKSKGWLFNWLDSSLKDDDIFKLVVNGQSEPQGLIALKCENRSNAVYVHLAESAPHNRGTDKKYKGVGGHLFAIAAQHSLEKGFGGFVFFDAKNKELVEHYTNTLSAQLLGMPHPYRMILDEYAAKKLLDTYTFGKE